MPAEHEVKAWLRSVHPQLRPAAEAVLAMPLLELADEHLSALRALRWPVPPLLDQPAVQQHQVPGLAGQPPVAVAVVGARDGQAARPALLYVHGGGYVMGRHDADLRRLQDTALALDCLVVSVDYRLAPENPYPAPVLDLLAVVHWLRGPAAGLGADPTRVAVLGESAGGGLAAMLTLAMRRRGWAPLCQQVLIYPMLDDRSGSSQPVAPPFGQMMWGPAQNRYGWSALLGQAAGAPQGPEDAVPAREPDLRGLPPCFIGTASLDLFLPENLAYAQRLMAAEVPTELVVVPGAFHGFDLLARDSPVAQRFTQAWWLALRQAFEGPFAATAADPLAPVDVPLSATALASGGPSESS